MKKTVLAIVLATTLAACEEEMVLDDHVIDSPPSIQEYCGNQNERWLRNLISRIEAAIPNAKTKSTGYEQLYMQERMKDGQVVDGEFELVLIVSATVDGIENVNFIAAGPINQDTCVVGPMRGAPGWDTSALSGNAGFPIGAN